MGAHPTRPQRRRSRHKEGSPRPIPLLTKERHRGVISVISLTRDPWRQAVRMIKEIAAERQLPLRGVPVLGPDSLTHCFWRSVVCSSDLAHRLARVAERLAVGAQVPQRARGADALHSRGLVDDRVGDHQIERALRSCGGRRLPHPVADDLAPLVMFGAQELAELRRRVTDPGSVDLDLRRRGEVGRGVAHLGRLDLGGSAEVGGRVADLRGVRGGGTGRGGAQIVADIPLGRVATTNEVAETIRWLATEAPASATGAIIGRDSNSRIPDPTNGIVVPAQYRSGQLVIFDADVDGVPVRHGHT